MTRNELAAKVVAYQKNSKRFDGFYLVVVLGGLAVIGVIGGSTPKENITVHVICFFALFGFLFSLIPISLRITKRRARQHGLICPSCNIMIVAQAARIAVASGRCCGCGQALISDLTS